MHLLKLLCFVSAAAVSTCLQCVSPEGKPVDWFALYKLPELNHKKYGPILRAGLGVYYLDIDNPSWNLSDGTVNDTKGALFRTLDPVYKIRPGDDDSLYMFYNDQPPPHQESLAHGHTKGVLAFSGESGFWLVQSTPHFPDQVDNGFHWPHSGLECGQSFLCISLHPSNLTLIAQQLYFNYPRVYDSWVPPHFLEEIPLLKKVMESEPPASPPWTSLQWLSSLGGNRFLSFAKYKDFGQDLYSDFVATTLKTSLLVESWQDGPEKLSSNCTLPYQVFNVEEIQLPGDVTFKETRDHSKWAISFNREDSSAAQRDWVCIGDINRQGHQMRRAGGTVCFQNRDVWISFKASVGNYSHCPSPNREEL